ncbi:MAG: cell division/cell wall cluster transcriptional repressor MraZ [Clostridia bacterium]|nr:cell division/cell wall cluster transcriptional repressor MraZ [Clostridia bacterium]
MLESANLLGSFQHSVDAKNRIFIPAKFRESLGETFVIFKSMRDKCIRVVSNAEWENYIAPIQKLPRELGENVLQALTDDAASVTPDAQGRIVIPQSLLEKVSITKNATVAGRGAYIEIWAEEVYAEKQASRDLASMLDQLAAYGL